MRWFLCAVGALGILTVGTPVWAGDSDSSLVIDHVDTSRYNEKGILRFYVDVHGADGQPIAIEPDDGSKLKFRLDKEKIKLEKGAVSVSKFDEPVAIAILFTNYGQFLPLTLEETEPLFELAVRGLTNLIDSLEKSAKVGVWLYNEDGLQKELDFTSQRSLASERLLELQREMERLRKSNPEDFARRAEKAEPRFYKDCLNTLKQIAKAKDLPRRRILILISDGRTQTTSKRKIENYIDKIVKKAEEKNIKVYGFGTTKDEEKYLKNIQTIAERTRGQYEKITKDHSILSDKIESLKDVIYEQYIIDVTAPGLPSDRKVQLQIQAETADGRVKGSYPKFKLPETPTNWWWYVKWFVLYPLIWILSLWFLVWTIKKIIAWRRGKKQDVVYVEHEEYSGPDRGKLQVFSGPLAGEVFHLTQDITTIGSIDGNDMVIPDEGVSKRHAGIKIEEMRYELADFGSTNGTLVNGRKINRQFLADGDTIRIGNSEMTFSLK